MQKRRYILLLQQPPWRLNGGGPIRNYWMAVGLARAYRLDVIVANEDPAGVPADFAALCNSVTSFPKAARSGYGARRALAALNPRESYFTAGQVSTAQRAFVQRLVDENEYQGIQVGDLNQQGSLPVRNCPAVWYDAHNCEYQLLRRQAEHESFPLRQIVSIDAARVKRIEANLVARSKWVTTCSAQDIVDLSRFCPGVESKASVISSGVEMARYAPVRDASPTRGCILLSGSFDWRPTQQGLIWFVEKVLPLLPKRVDGIDISVRIAGRMTPALIEELSKHPRIALSPNPADMRPELSIADIIAVPVLASSGVRLRIYEAWAAGRPVVTTPTGALGLDYRDGDELLARTSPNGFADAAVQLIRDRALWRHVRDTGVRRAAEFDWPTIVERLVALHARVFSN